ncbi:hypothetical protein [Streptomyces sp. NPDC012616]|uniref:hypothetical protein n=1 Tax=Streptomyces sp. NPDC012616 TaxID=3364840 RepID=UPI0036EE96A8
MTRGIAKARDVRPDERMRRLLEEAVAIGNAGARSVGLRAPAEGFHVLRGLGLVQPALHRGTDKQVAKELDVSVGDIDGAVQQAATEVR